MVPTEPYAFSYLPPPPLLGPSYTFWDVGFRMYAPAKLAITLALEAFLRDRPRGWLGYRILAFHPHYLAGLIVLSSLLSLKGKNRFPFLSLLLPIFLWSPVMVH